MHVYFVRHGETELNSKNIHQSPNTPISAQGREMVLSTAEMLRGVNPDLLVSSEYTRALESARIIGAHTGLTPITNGLFYEIVRPSKFYNTSVFSPITLWFFLLFCIHRNNPKWQYDDAESYFDISERATRALAFIRTLKDTNSSVVIVSHSVFIQVMVSYMCQNQPLGIFEFGRTFLRARRMKNASVVHVEYIGSEAANTCSWRVIEE